MADEHGEVVEKIPFEYVVRDAYRLAAPRTALDLGELARLMGQVYDMPFNDRVIMWFNQRYVEQVGRPLIERVAGTRPARYVLYHPPRS